MFQSGKRYYNTETIYTFLELDTERISKLENLPDTFVTPLGNKRLSIYLKPIYNKIKSNYHLLIGEGGTIFEVTSAINRIKMDMHENNLVFITDRFIDDKRYVLFRKRGLLRELGLLETDPDDETPDPEVE